MEAGTFIHGVEWGMGRQGICTEEGGIWEGGRERLTTKPKCEAGRPCSARARMPEHACQRKHNPQGFKLE